MLLLVTWSARKLLLYHMPTQWNFLIFLNTFVKWNIFAIILFRELKCIFKKKLQSSFCAFAIIWWIFIRSKKEMCLTSKYVPSSEKDCSSNIRNVCKQRRVLIDPQLWTYTSKYVSDPNYEISKKYKQNCMRNFNI